MTRLAPRDEAEVAEAIRAANVSNATVRCLSNLKLGRMLEDRHAMSRRDRMAGVIQPRQQRTRGGVGHASDGHV